LQSQVTGVKINHALLATRSGPLMRAGDDDEVRKRLLLVLAGLVARSPDCGPNTETAIQ
jgi:hypothetical protein